MPARVLPRTVTTSPGFSVFQQTSILHLDNTKGHVVTIANLYKFLQFLINVSIEEAKPGKPGDAKPPVRCQRIEELSKWLPGCNRKARLFMAGLFCGPETARSTL
jgi:hypothetical protein